MPFLSFHHPPLPLHWHSFHDKHHWYDPSSALHPWHDIWHHFLYPCHHCHHYQYLHCTCLHHYHDTISKPIFTSVIASPSLQGTLPSPVSLPFSALHSSIYDGLYVRKHLGTLKTHLIQLTYQTPPCTT
jgi:hypothetical protein